MRMLRNGARMESAGESLRALSLERRADESQRHSQETTLGFGKADEREEAEETDARHQQAEQLQWQHVSEQRQLHQEQLEQLKAFKTQLVSDLLTQLSPRPKPTGTPAAYNQRPPPVIHHGPPEFYLPLGSPGKPHSPQSAQHIHPLPHSATTTPTSIPTQLEASLSGSVTFPGSQQLPDSPHYSNPSPSIKQSPQPSLPHKDEHEAHTVYSTPPPYTSHTLSPSTNTRQLHQNSPPFNSAIPEQFSATQQPTLATVPAHSSRWAEVVESASMHSSVKAALIEKHTKHVEDLKSYYETQLAKLQESLIAAEKESSVRDTLPPSPRSLPPLCIDTKTGLERLPRSPTASQQRMDTELRANNERLRTECASLEYKLQQCTRVNQALEAKLERQKQYLLDWQTQADTSSHTIAVLQDKLEATRTQLKQQDSIVEQLQADLQVSVGEIQFWKEQRSQEAAKFKQVSTECEDLRGKSESLEDTLASVRDELSSAHREMGRLDAALKTTVAREQNLTSTIHKLEDRIRHLEHVNNRLHGQATHYSLGSYPNSPDDAKLHHRTTSPSPTPSRPPPSHKSPLTTPPHVHPISHPRTAPLNRRKWLEPSDPGLILGTPAATTTPTHPPPPPAHPHASHRPRSHTLHNESSDVASLSSSPLLQSTGQTLVQEHYSDSGSSNEGEDPTSLTRQGYMNARRKELATSVPVKDELVASTLSAIQRGRIRLEAAGQSTTTKKKTEKEGVEERVKNSLQVVAEAERRLVDLCREKENLESVLQRAPRHGGRVTRHSRQAQLETEQRMEVVLREIGSVKMTLRNHHAFQK